ncbi:MAG: hypothetical protein DRQ13_09680 [Ignavibacteriae bacterium]|nr:MAG: hypothetical protein DRQ13_09680 [Ignavibacteriota bacterium]
MKTKKKKFIVLFSLLILSSFILYSCYPDYGLTTSDYDTVITLYDNSADFNKPTYAMPDTVVHFVEEGEEDNISRTKDALILSTIASNMTKLGYERVYYEITPADTADFVILVGVTTAENYGHVYYPGYGYWGGWGGWYGGYYPYYPGWGYSYTYSYTTGTIFLSMLDTEKINPGDSFKAVWGARLNGVLNSTASTTSRITQRINDAFNQSPYLGTN